MGIVNQHQITTFATPQNATSPIDANQVRGNDNTIKTSYNVHDADTTIHLQNGVIASRPAASTAGQMWLATDAGAVYQYLDTGAVWVEVNYLRTTGGAVTGLTTFSAGLTVSAGVTSLQSLSATTGVFSGGLTSTINAASSPIVAAVNGTTFEQYMRFANTGNSTYFGIESSAGGSQLGGTAAYATIVGTASARSLQFVTNNVVQQSIASTGVSTFSQQVIVSTGGLTVTGNSTITGTLGGLTGLTVASGGASITGNSTITGTLGGLTGLTVTSGNVAVSSGTLTVSGAFGCNTKAAQTAFASGGALNAYATGGFGLFAQADMLALYNLVVAIRAALVADGIMS